MPQRLFRVQGRVQGVGFRWWTRSLARDIGVTGSVRNLPDGSVEVRVRGTDDSISRLRAELESGPPGAEVLVIEESPIDDVPGQGFEIQN